jgi:hypothetical protein
MCRQGIHSSGSKPLRHVGHVIPSSHVGDDGVETREMRNDLSPVFYSCAQLSNPPAMMAPPAPIPTTWSGGARANKERPKPSGIVKKTATFPTGRGRNSPSVCRGRGCCGTMGILPQACGPDLVAHGRGTNMKSVLLVLHAARGFVLESQLCRPPARLPYGGGSDGGTQPTFWGST